MTGGRVRAAIALGSNLGDRAAALAFARAALDDLPGTRVVAASSIEETAPLGDLPQPSYLNQMLLVETRLGPQALLRACLGIERAAGRERTEPWASRTLDLDIVRYGDATIRTPELVVPHPGLSERAFWRRELAELGWPADATRGTPRP